MLHSVSLKVSYHKTDFSNPRFFETPDNSYKKNRFSFLVKYYIFTLDSSNQFSFPLKFPKFGIPL